MGKLAADLRQASANLQGCERVRVGIPERPQFLAADSRHAFATLRSLASGWGRPFAHPQSGASGWGQGFVHPQLRANGCGQEIVHPQLDGSGCGEGIGRNRELGTVGIGQIRRNACRNLQTSLAEREGFEPPVPRGTPVFKTGVIDHSTISPMLN